MASTRRIEASALPTPSTPSRAVQKATVVQSKTMVSEPISIRDVRAYNPTPTAMPPPRMNATCHSNARTKTLERAPTARSSVRALVFWNAVGERGLGESHREDADAPGVGDLGRIRHGLVAPG